MADLIDQAAEQEAVARDEAISATLARIRKTQMHPVGSCHNCGEQIHLQALFCDADCGADHELRMRARRHN